MIFRSSENYSPLHTNICEFVLGRKLFIMQLSSYVLYHLGDGPASFPYSLWTFRPGEDDTLFDRLKWMEEALTAWLSGRSFFHVDYQMGDELFILSSRAHYTLFIAIYAELLWDNHDFPSSGRIVKVFLRCRSSVRHAGADRIGILNALLFLYAIRP